MRHSEIWVNELQYENYKIDGIVVGDSISFSNLKAAIAAELDIDVSRKEIEIRYIVEGNSCPMKLKNDMSVKLYFELKKNEPGFSIYPLCIDTIEKNSGTVHNFDGRSGEITCVEGTTNDTQALAIVENSLFESHENAEVGVANVIINSDIVDVKTGLIYKDKATLVDVMTKYKIKNNFNCKVKRSDQQRYDSILMF